MLYSIHIVFLVYGGKAFDHELPFTTLFLWEILIAPNLQEFFTNFKLCEDWLATGLLLVLKEPRHLSQEF